MTHPTPRHPSVVRVANAGRSIVGPDTRVEDWNGWRRAVVGSNKTALEIARLAAPYTLEAYTLARCVGSEVGISGNPHDMLAVAECVRNEARAKGRTIHFRLLNTPRAKHREPFYGEQRGRYAATLRDPREKAMVAASEALAGSQYLPSGSRRFFNPKVQAGGRQGSGVLDPPDDKLQQWAAEGWEWIGHHPGLDPWELMVLKKVKGADPGPSIALVRDRMGGRKTYSIPAGAVASKSGTVALAGVALIGATLYAIRK